MASRSLPTWGLACVAVCTALYPLVPVVDWLTEWCLGAPLQLERHLLSVMVFGLLTLALCLQAGQAGIVQLGIAAFFGLGAFGAGVLTVEKYPMQLGFWWALIIVPPVCAAVGAGVSGPCARLKGDYLAMVTLAFGELTRVVLLNLEAITDGSRGLNPLPVADLPHWLVAHMSGPTRQHAEFLALYYAALVSTAITYVGLVRLTRAPLGRALCALREDPLACAALGLSPSRLRLTAFALGAGIAGGAGVLYATYLTTTAEPSNYDFNLSTMVLCAAILGGLRSPGGALLGAALLVTFDNLVAPGLARLMALAAGGTRGADPGLWWSFSSWRLMIFGASLIAFMRLRPEGIVSLGHEKQGRA